MKFDIKKIALLIFWFVTVIGYEFVYRWMTLRGGWSHGLFEMIVFTIPIAILVYMLGTLFSKKINKIINSIMLVVLFAIFFAQMLYYGVFNGVFSIYAISGTGEAFSFWRLILTTLYGNLFRFVLLCIPLVFYFVFRNKVFDFSKNKPIYLGITAAALLLFTSFTFIYIDKDKKDIYSSYNLYFNTQAPVLSAKKFGLLTTIGIDLKRVIFGFEEKSVEITIDNQTSSSVSELEYNTLDIDLDSLIADETDETIISMHEYFNSLQGTTKNEYTGMFEGKNVIFILAEGLDTIAIDPDLTPTLYKLANSGFNFTNYYSPKYPASTADGEFRTEWSLISSRGDYYTLYSYKDVYSPYVFSNSFSDYNINIYHDWTSTFYLRNEYFASLGYENFTAVDNGLDIYYSYYSKYHVSDLDMVEASIDDYIDSEDPFFTYYITVSGHFPYNYSTNVIVQKNWDLVSDLPYSDEVKGFLASNIELDRAVQELIEQLTVAGELDDTVFVITPDHYPYGLTNEQINEVAEYNRDDDFELYHSDLIIWNSAMESTVKIDKVGSQPDVLPTLLNLFGIEYDSRMIVGKDLLSDSEGLVILANRSWITDEGRYNSVTGEAIANDGTTLDEDYVNKINTEVSNQFTISNLILDNDYYSIVFNQDEE